MFIELINSYGCKETLFIGGTTQGNIVLKKLSLAQKIYEEYFLNKEFLCVYEEQGVFKEFKLVFNSGHFKHLTGVEYIKNNQESSAKNVYKALKNGRLNLSNIKIGNFAKIKLKYFPDLQNIFYSPSIYYKFSPEKGNSNWLFIDSFITKNNRKFKATSLGITEESNNKFVPSSLFYDIPERKGKYIGKVLLVGFRNILEKETVYNTIFRVANIHNISNEIKNKFRNLENYNCFTGNILKNFQHKKGEFRWIAKDDVIKQGISKKINAELKTLNNSNLDEEKIYKSTPIGYYNVIDLEISEEIGKNFVSLKQEETITIKSSKK